MADKSVGELIAAQSVAPTDLFVLEQNGTAKKLTGQILENWLVSFADGHGGIQSIVKKSTSGLVDTYRITLSDTTTFDFMVTNGKSIKSISKASTSGLVDTYRIAFNDGTSSTFTVTNGEKGDKGDNQYVWIKYASQKPTATSHSFGDVADDWIGIYSGSSDTAPTDWTQYEWFKIKGERGDTGDPATLVSSEIRYQVGDSGTIIPSGSWQASVPSVTPGKFLWTRQVLQFNSGAPITSYSVSRFGIDGTGAVSTVASVAPDANGNVPLTADDVNALPIGGGTMEGAINMNGQPIRGLNMPTEENQAANKGYVDKTRTIAQGGTAAESKEGARENLEVAQAIESDDHPGCYYRIMDGETEWLNPPLVLGGQYRTTERYNGKAVYVTTVDCGQVVSGGNKVVSVAHLNATSVFQCNAMSSAGSSIPHRYSADHYSEIYASHNSIVLHCGSGVADWTVTAYLWYIKD